MEKSADSFQRPYNSHLNTLRLISRIKQLLLSLGTNGYFTEDQLNTLLNTFSKADIYLVNTRVPRSWESKVNTLLLEKTKEKDNITLVDWHSESIKHPEYFGSDGVHLGSRGKDALTNLINKAMK